MSVLTVDPPFYDGDGGAEYCVLEEARVPSGALEVVFDGVVADLAGFMSARGYRALTPADRKDFDKHRRVVVDKDAPAAAVSLRRRARRRGARPPAE